MKKTIYDELPWLQERLQRLLADFEHIEKMTYGSLAQIAAADIWYPLFHDTVRAIEVLESLPEASWTKVHCSDVGYLARQRWLKKQGVIA